MSLTLIQEQVLEALVDAVAGDSRRRDHGVTAAAVLEKLRRRRPRPTSAAYVRLILRDLDGCRLDGRPLIGIATRRRNGVRYTPTNAGIELVEARRIKEADHA